MIRGLLARARALPVPVRFVLAALLGVLTHLLVGLILATAMWLAPRWCRLNETRRQKEAVIEELPEAVDLFRLAVSSGLNVHLATEAVSQRLSGPIGAELRTALSQVTAGRRLADALEPLPDTLGEPVRPLIRTLCDANRYGTDLEAALEQVGSDSRLVRRRLAEERARRIPLQLLLPLVLCILPAFGLLTVVPVLVETFTALRR